MIDGYDAWLTSQKATYWVEASLKITAMDLDAEEAAEQKARCDAMGAELLTEMRTTDGYTHLTWSLIVASEEGVTDREETDSLAQGLAEDAERTLGNVSVEVIDFSTHKEY